MGCGDPVPPQDIEDSEEFIDTLDFCELWGDGYLHHYVGTTVKCSTTLEKIGAAGLSTIICYQLGFKLSKKYGFLLFVGCRVVATALILLWPGCETFTFGGYDYDKPEESFKFWTRYGVACKWHASPSELQPLPPPFSDIYGHRYTWKYPFL